jgi:hypothetical protein
VGGAAIAVVQLSGDIDGLLADLSIRPVPHGRAALRDVPGVDSLVVARVAPDHALLFPHAGRAVLRRMIAALERAGAALDADPDPRTIYPEARSLIEARTLAALAGAQSPLAIDLLLDQPRRWAAADHGELHLLPPTESRTLRRLIAPPLVVALGPPNIGKSSLLNALAGRSVALVADEPGTTRDHVGVTLDLAGLVVRAIDTPGIDPRATSPIDREAQALALTVATGADLLLLCADPASGFLDPPPALPTSTPVLRVTLRADLGPPRPGSDLAVVAPRGESLEALTARLRDALVPPALLADPRAWTFWDSA